MAQNDGGCRWPLDPLNSDLRPWPTETEVFPPKQSKSVGSPRGRASGYARPSPNTSVGPDAQLRCNNPQPPSSGTYSNLRSCRDCQAPVPPAPEDPVCFRQRRCGACHQLFYIYPSCDRGQLYCSDWCRRGRCPSRPRPPAELPAPNADTGLPRRPPFRGPPGCLRPPKGGLRELPFG